MRYINPRYLLTYFKQLQELLKSDHWLRRYCILSGAVFYFEPPCIIYIILFTRQDEQYENNMRKSITSLCLTVILM